MPAPREIRPVRLQAAYGLGLDMRLHRATRAQRTPGCIFVLGFILRAGGFVVLVMPAASPDACDPLRKGEP